MKKGTVLRKTAVKRKISPRVFVLSAPSGAGKTTVCLQLLKKDRRLKQVITATTRPPRKGERDGRDYLFVTEEKFRRMIDEGQLLEHAAVHGQWYGTPRAAVEALMRKGRDPILVIDVQGGLRIKQLMKEAVLIFLMPPSIDALKARLTKRGLDTAAVIKTRVQNAIREMLAAPRYDYAVINDRLPRAVAAVGAVIRKERERRS